MRRAISQASLGSRGGAEGAWDAASFDRDAVKLGKEVGHVRAGLGRREKRTASAPKVLCETGSPTKKFADAFKRA